MSDSKEEKYHALRKIEGGFRCANCQHEFYAGTNSEGLSANRLKRLMKGANVKCDLPSKE